MLRIRVLGEDDELARIVGPVAQRVKVEGTPERCGCRRSFDASQRIAIPNAPPTFHFASPSAVAIADNVVQRRLAAKAPLHSHRRQPPGGPR